jgi:hypothetical protein
MSLAVVIPLYNHERYIRAVLESVLAQTRPVGRVFVIDDGSSDRSVEAAREVSDGRIQIFTQENAGAHATINRGIGMAGEFDYVAILNSDDLFQPQRIEKCLVLLESQSKTDVVVTGVKMIDEASAELPPDHPKARWLETGWQGRCNDLAQWLGYVNFAKTTSNIVARTGYLLAHPFRPYRYVHDYFFLAQAAIERRLAVLDEPLLLYRTHTANTIKSGAAGSVAREVTDVALSLLRELAPQLAASADTRLAMTRFLRALMENNSDFRAETFVHIVAQLTTLAGGEEMAALVAGLNVEQFPELAAKNSREMRARVAGRACREQIDAVQSSRWQALGRVLGLAPDFSTDENADAEMNLAAVKKQIAGSAWLALGRRLGAFKPPEQ